MHFHTISAVNALICLNCYKQFMKYHENRLNYLTRNDIITLIREIKPPILPIQAGRKGGAIEP